MFLKTRQSIEASLVHGFQIQKGKYVSFTNEELKKLESGAGHEIEIIQFIPISEVDPVYFASAYLLGCGSGSAKAYHLLNAAMIKSKRAALAKFVMRGKEHLVLIRPYSDVLMLHLMHHADEIRSSEQIEHGAKTAIGATELKLAERLIGDLSKDKFETDKFKDTYREKILTVAVQKAAGQEVTAPEAPKRGKVIDLMSALKDSLKSQKRASRKTAKTRLRTTIEQNHGKRVCAALHRVRGTRRAVAGHAREDKSGVEGWNNGDASWSPLLRCPML